ncbi:SMP-30/gluconolactonase/LRE family protein [Methylobacterium sp. J-030]|uniref:SMP-30/gluconolactonase/LRE family protein n=1 Tax=Methylobacterium sp. J-030 TaxID=2836627 RepID=UPI001FBA9290|nr:SMP-30/gluconolactonase/LRE family protein [Methylobacterium sp. J-030]MCJ2070807.1 SMP-30/gluconolactonase/LRE family protein [Methylobacterium sp. J-030]
MNWYPAPETIETEVFTSMPQDLRRPVVTDWAQANKGGHPVDCFLEGPCFDAAGNFHVTDIPHGRIFRIAPDGTWTQLAEWDGEPNGLAFHPDGRLLIADYKNGILSLAPGDDRPEPLLARRNSERFKGVNDLILSRAGDLYFTDQGQTGLQDPTGRVYRLSPSGRLDCLLSTGVSPNGLVLSADESVLFVAMTRDNAVWRVPLQRDGSVSKAGRFASFHGTSGPDGMVMDEGGNLLVAHASLGAVFALGPQGEPLARIQSCRGQTVTNLTFGRADRSALYMTESQTGTVLRARWRRQGLPVIHR